MLKVPVGPHDHVQGAADAPLTLVEYGDYQCPYCGAAYPVVKRLQKQFGTKLRFVFRNFPLTQAHPEALNAAITAEFAAAHDRFWPIHDSLYEQQDRLGLALYEELVVAAGLAASALREALDSQTYAKGIVSDFNGGVRSGVNGTPCFFINGSRYEGPASVEALTQALQI